MAVGRGSSRVKRSPRRDVRSDCQNGFAAFAADGADYDHGQLLSQREGFHMKQGAASEEPVQRGEEGSEDRAHTADANASA